MAINSLRVLDLTPPSEPNVGKRLADDIPLWSSIGRVNISSSYVRIGNRIDLECLFQRIVESCHIQREVPILHFEAHGCRDKISVGESESLIWSDFLELLRAVNVATRNNLLVTMATCKSAWSSLSVAPDRPCPFCLLIAPIEDVSIGEVEDGFQNFYRTLFANYDIDGCLEALNARIVSPGNAFVAVDAEDLFLGAAKAYVEKLCCGATRQKRLENLVSRAVVGGITKRTPLPGIRKKLRRELWADPGTYLKPFFEKFMMIDQFPENESRFRFDIERDVLMEAMPIWHPK